MYWQFQLPWLLLNQHLARGSRDKSFQSYLAAKTAETLICTQNWLGSSPISAHESYLSNVEDEENYKLK
jgi:hypothetical protein